MNGILTDLRFAMRQLAGKPGFAAAAILTLALGIGANVAVFSFLSGYLFKPLPYANGSQLVHVYTSFPKLRAEPFGISMPLYRVMKQQQELFSDTAVFYQREFNLNVDGNAQRVDGILATASLFQVLRAQPVLGHAFSRRNTHDGDGQVAVISYGLWQARFGGAPNVIGKSVKIGGEAYRIMGVMPQGFAFPGDKVSLWLPYQIEPKMFSPDRIFSVSPQFIGRLESGVEIASARTRISHAVNAYVNSKVNTRLQQVASDTEFTMGVESWRQYLLGDRPATLWLLQGAALLILLITCVNIANLLLSRILGRSHEMAMRSALGASRAKLARQLLGEALCLTVPGGLAGVGLAWIALQLLSGSALGPGASVFAIALDWRVGLFALAAVMLTAVLVSVLPLRHLAKTNLQSLLKEGSRSSSGRHSGRVRNLLIVTELTFAAALLALSGLLLHSFMNLQAVDPGFRKNNVLIAGLFLPPTDHKGSEALRHFYTNLAQRVETLPGVREAAVSQNVPLGGASSYNVFSILGQKPPASGIPPGGMFVAVSQGYFKALGIPILRGRGFNDSDTGTTNAIVGAKLADKYFHGASPIGKTIVMGDMKHVIVGVVPSIKFAKLSQAKPSAVIYVNGPLMPPTRNAQLVVHIGGAPGAFVEPLKNLLHSVDPNMAVYDIHTMRRQIAVALGDKRLTMTLLLVFGGIALVLAIIGVYGVLSYAVGQRRNEFGIRLALGASPGGIKRLVVGDGLKLLLIGLVTGLALAVAVASALDSLLFQVAPYDPVTLIVTIAVLGATTSLACYLPARRTAKLNPAEVILDQ